NGDLQGVHFWAGNSQHQSCCVSEVFDENNRSGPVGQVFDAVEFELDVVEFLTRFFDAVLQLKINYRNAHPRNRLNAVALGVFSNLLSHLAGHESLRLLSSRAWPATQNQRLTDRNVWIFALWHVEIAVNSPGHGGQQQDPRDVPLFRKVSGGVVG